MLHTHPGIHGDGSSSESLILVGSGLERFTPDEESGRRWQLCHTHRLEHLREEMARDALDYYVVPSVDAHGSEYAAACDQRMEWISGFTGSTGQAIVSKTAAYVVTDSRYWAQAANQINSDWHLIQAGRGDGPKDWVEWLVENAENSRIGIDARMLCCAEAAELNNLLHPKGSRLVYPRQNLIDLIWRDKPSRPGNPIHVHHMEFTGKSAADKLADIRTWVRKASQPGSSTVGVRHIATLITALDSVSYILNLRGRAIPFGPLFQSYLLITLDKAILFIDPANLAYDVEDYLKAIGVDTRVYNDLWSYLRNREWGEGKVIIAPETSYAIALMLTNSRHTVMPSFASSMEAVKNETEINGMRRAYLRDSASFVRFIAWLEGKLSEGYDITEYEAAFRLSEYRRTNKYFIGLAYETVSASGPNTTLPRYSVTKSTAAMIDRDAPYLNDSGGWYKDGVCGTARTWSFGRPTPDHCKAYTQVLQRHIAIDSAIFPEGTSGHQLDILAGKGPWQDGVDCGPETGYDIGCLKMHEGPHSFSNNITLVPGHVITNEPCLYFPGKFGIRIKSALTVRRIKVRPEFDDDHWLAFERLTWVPIQTKMIKGGILSKDEKQWVKDHNRQCLELLQPYLRDDKRALKWLNREAGGLGISLTSPGGISIGRG